VITIVGQEYVDMMQAKCVVQLYRTRDSQAPDETIEFTFSSAAREYARDQIIAGKARKAVVKDRDGTVLETFPS
jgi:hypothetical protein